ncbi:MAG TPA: MarR family winged helix-turn-helix transcriptional regulator [Bryobacteraceae bacterium]|nr:MarR family winged helix-turn-helix transcriptional regulator [Bryobacteraceae bacterium]
MTGPLPLSALLSQVLVAFIIEFDNEFEHQMPHRTSLSGGSREGPWLVSMAMYSTCMRFVGDDPITVREVEALARTKTNWNGMERWKYIVVEPDPKDPRLKPPRPAWLVRPTAKGRQAREIWRTLFGTIESRWRSRFGDAIDGLREALRAIAVQLDAKLPDCLPILGYGLFSKEPDRKLAPAAGSSESSDTLAALLSRVLLALATEFEQESVWSLAVYANVIRVLDGQGKRVRDLPMLSGVSKEGIAMALGVMQKGRIVKVDSGEDGRTKVAQLTSKGLEVQAKCHRLLGAIEARWQARFGEEKIRQLRDALSRIVNDQSSLSRGIEPYPDGWRASVRRPQTLPHYPMVLHRGGFPDGS